MLNKSMGFVKFPIENIRIPERLREVDPAHVDSLAESIRQVGDVMNPIVLGAEGAEGADLTKAFLIAGAHRLEAAKKAGLQEIGSMIWENVTEDEARLMEIDENLIRHELIALDRAFFISTRKDVYEILHPHAKHGGDRKSEDAQNQNDTMSFCSDTAERTGLGKRTIERAVKIAKGISPSLRKRLVGSELARNQSELLKLANMTDPTLQGAVVELILSGEFTKVENASKHVTGHVEQKKDISEKELDKLVDIWNRSSRRVKDDFLAILVDAGEVTLCQVEAAE